jgi:hypothetical protein
MNRIIRTINKIHPRPFPDSRPFPKPRPFPIPHTARHYHKSSGLSYNLSGPMQRMINTLQYPEEKDKRVILMKKVGTTTHFENYGFYHMPKLNADIPTEQDFFSYEIHDLQFEKTQIIKKYAVLEKFILAINNEIHKLIRLPYPNPHEDNADLIKLFDTHLKWSTHTAVSIQCWSESFHSSIIHTDISYALKLTKRDVSLSEKNYYIDTLKSFLVGTREILRQIEHDTRRYLESSHQTLKIAPMIIPYSPTLFNNYSEIANKINIDLQPTISKIEEDIKKVIEIDQLNKADKIMQKEQSQISALLTYWHDVITKVKSSSVSVS